MGKGAIDGGMLSKIAAGCAVLSCCCVCLGLFLPYVWATNVTPGSADVTANQGLFGVYLTANNDDSTSKTAVSCYNEGSNCNDNDDTSKYVGYDDLKSMPNDYCDTGGNSDGGKAYKAGNDSYKSKIDGICTGRGLYVFFFVLAIIAAIAAAVGVMKPGPILYAAAAMCFVTGFFGLVAGSYISNKWQTDCDGSDTECNWSFSFGVLWYQVIVYWILTCMLAYAGMQGGGGDGGGDDCCDETSAKV
jgi:hypothetical protein